MMSRQVGLLIPLVAPTSGRHTGSFDVLARYDRWDDGFV
jgi:hypothetical protein